MSAYYNEMDRHAAAWLRELIADGQIADGTVDERDIRDVRPDDLSAYRQVHLFAGIAGWGAALRRAGWDDDRPVWTVSCPCPSFSAAGRGAGFADERHLWPAAFWLIEQCKPDVIMGEQVAAAIAHGWLDLIRDDLESLGYAVGAIVLPACSAGAFHIRERLWFVAESERAERRPLNINGEDGRNWMDSRRQEAHGDSGTCCQVRSVAYCDDARRGSRRSGQAREQARIESSGLCAAQWLGEPSQSRLEVERREPGAPRQAILGDEREASKRADAPIVDGLADPESRDGKVSIQQWGSQSASPEPRRGSGSGFWDDAIWIPCRDGKFRPTSPEPAIQPLAHGVSGRVGLLRGAGNAIVPQVAAEIISAYMETDQ